MFGELDSAWYIFAWMLFGKSLRKEVTIESQKYTKQIWILLAKSYLYVVSDLLRSPVGLLAMFFSLRLLGAQSSCMAVCQYERRKTDSLYLCKAILFH